MAKKYSGINKAVLQRWDLAAELMRIPEEAYDMPVKIVCDKTRKSSYTFGVIYSPYRKKRPSEKNVDTCPLCRVASEAQVDLRRNLFPERILKDFIVTPNEYPSTHGACLAITKNERPMYTTKHIGTLKGDLETISNLCVKTGYLFFHQTEGAGATFPRHEHWQLINWSNIYGRAGDKYGFEVAETDNLPGFDGVRFMPNFPFAHLIFDIHDFGRIEFFLKSLQKKHPKSNGLNSVPHTIIQGDKDVLIVPFKGSSGKKLGAAHTAGHMYVHEEYQFKKADYAFCIGLLKQGIFLREELKLENYLQS
ncbi:MAG: hypothetical protein ABIH65_02315 [Nanoarchaeota archaeon]